MARAMQGHSIPHVNEGTPQYAARGTYYDFYESILKRGLVAGGQQGAAFRRNTFPGKGPFPACAAAVTL